MKKINSYLSKYKLAFALLLGLLLQYCVGRNSGDTKINDVSLKKFELIDQIPKYNIPNDLILTCNPNKNSITVNRREINIENNRENAFNHKGWKISPPIRQVINGKKLKIDEFVYGGNMATTFSGKLNKKDVIIKTFLNKKSIKKLHTDRNMPNPLNFIINNTLETTESELKLHKKVITLCKNNNRETIAPEIYTIYKGDYNIYMVMEKLNKPPFNTLIKNYKNIILKTLDNLVFLEKNGIHHKDLSPLNLAFLPRIIDFQQIGIRGTGIFSLDTSSVTAFCRSMLFLYLFEGDQLRAKNEDMKSEYKLVHRTAFEDPRNPQKIYKNTKIELKEDTKLEDMKMKLKQTLNIPKNEWIEGLYEFLHSEFCKILISGSFDEGKFKSLQKLYDTLLVAS